MVKINAKRKYRHLKEKSDFEILALIVNSNSDEAQTEFYYRYRSFLLQICRMRCKNFDGGEQLADDIFQNTFIKALNGIISLYNKVSKDNTNISNHIKAWLVVIAKNELREFLRRNPDEKKLSNQFRLKSDEVEVEFEINADDNIDIKKPSIQKEKLDNGLSNLSDKERHILMVYMEYYNSSEPNRHLPDEVISQLCNYYNIKSNNLRQIKSRALKKLIRIIN